MDGSVSIVWGGDERTFRLAIDQCLALEEKRGCGLRELWMRLGSDGWYVEDIRESIRLGLLGAGVEPKEARRLVDLHCSDGHLFKSVLAAFTIVSAAIAAPEGEQQVGKEGAAAAPGTDSPLPPSTEQAQQ